MLTVYALEPLTKGESSAQDDDEFINIKFSPKETPEAVHNFAQFFFKGYHDRTTARRPYLESLACAGVKTSLREPLLPGSRRSWRLTVLLAMRMRMMTERSRLLVLGFRYSTPIGASPANSSNGGVSGGAGASLLARITRSPSPAVRSSTIGSLSVSVRTASMVSPSRMSLRTPPPILPMLISIERKGFLQIWGLSIASG